MRYVDAGYAVALGTLALYGGSLLLRRRRWQRAFELSEPPATEEEAAPVRGGRP
jgi:hypothetical protein